MRRFSWLVLVIGLIGSISLAAPAAADPGNPFDVTLRGSNVVFKGGSCRQVPVTVRHTGPTNEYSTVSVDFQAWLGNSYKGEGSAYMSGTSVDSAYYYWCPYEGLGTFSLGPSNVEWNDFGTDQSATFTDNSRALMVVRQWSTVKLNSVRSHKRGKKRYLTFGGQGLHYSADASAIAGSSGRSFVLQRKRGKGAWKNVRSVRGDSLGKFSLTVRSKKKSYYRLATSSTSTTWGATSSATRR